MAGTPEQHIYVLKNQLNESGTALEEETRQKVGIKTENEKLTAELQKQKEAYAKLEKHAKNCEKATNKAQKDVKNTKGYSDHVINSQKGNLRSAEKRAEESTRDLKAWRDKYGWSVEKPAEEKYALQMRVSEWQSKAEKARNEIASLEKQIEGTPEQVGLHQALEEWEEHQGCSAGFADLEDTIHDLKSELTTSKENYQKARSDIKPLQIKADQLEQAKKTLQELQVKADQLEQVNQAFQQLQIKADELEQASKAWHDQDKTQEYILHIQKLESDLEQHQKTEGELKALKDKTQEYILHIQKLESDLEQHQKTEGEMKALQEKVHYLEQASEAFHDQGKTDIDMLDDDMLDKERLESDLKALQDRHQKTESEMETLQEKAGQLEQANIAFQDQDDSHKDMLQKLDSDLKTTKEQLQKTESDMEALQGKADQLETLQGMVDQLNSDLKTTKEQLQTTESDMEALQGKADKLETLQGMVDQLKSDLKTTKDQLQITESDMAALQGKADQLESELENTEEQDPTTESDEVTVEEMANQLEALSGILDQQESELNETKEAFQRIKTDKKELQEKADQLEQANKAFQEKEDERLLAMLLEDEKPRDKEIKDAVQRSIEERTQLIAQAQASKKPEQDIKTQQVRVETPEKAERSQVSTFARIMGSPPFICFPAQTPCLC